MGSLKQSRPLGAKLRGNVMDMCGFLCVEGGSKAGELLWKLAMLAIFAVAWPEAQVEQMALTWISEASEGIHEILSLSTIGNHASTIGHNTLCDSRD